MPPRDHATTPTLDPIEDISRRRILTAIPAIGLMAAGLACGDDSDDDPAGDSANTTGSWPRVISTVLGPVTINSRPERAVALTDAPEVDFILALGVVPVLTGISNAYGTGDRPTEWAAEQGLTNEARYDATTWEIDLEAVAAANPDIIVGQQWMVEPLFDQLSRIAPTITLSDEAYADWKGFLRTVGEAMGREAEAETAIEETEALLAGQSHRIEAAVGDRRVTFFHIYQDQMSIEGAPTAQGQTFADLGVKLYSPGDADRQDYSLEQFNVLDDADILIGGDYSGGDLETLETQPLLKNLEIFQSGRYVPLGIEVSRAIYMRTPLSLRWSAPRLAEAIITAAEGRGKKLT